MVDPSNTEWVEDCLHWRGKILNGSRAHWCHDWDGLPVDDTCSEALCCSCFSRTEDELDKIRLLLTDVTGTR